MVSKQTYKWNSKGQLSEYSIYGDDASKQKTIEYFYGPQDSLIYTLTTFGFNKNIEKTTYKRDFKHHLIEMSVFRNDLQVRRETYDLNDNFQIIGKKVYNGKNKLTLSYTYTYDEHNYMLSEIAKDNKVNGQLNTIINMKRINSLTGLRKLLTMVGNLNILKQE